MQGCLHAAQEAMVLLGVEQREVASPSDMTPSEAWKRPFQGKRKGSFASLGTKRHKKLS